VFRAYDPERDRLVAIKLFKLDLPPERVHRLVAAFERLIAAELTHPVLAAPLATGMADVTAFLAQDFVGLESLDLAVREYGPAPPADAIRVASQLAGALDSAAAVSIFHGALHPRDVLLSSDETRLTGVGVARALEQVGVTLPVRRPYTAPERMAGATWDRRADVFSLAALMYELLWARRVSGTGAAAVEELTAIEGGDPIAVRAAFGRALAEDPGERFATALEFAEALRSAFPGLAVSSGRPAGASPAAKRVSRMELEPRLPLDAPEIDVELSRPAARYEDLEMTPPAGEPVVRPSTRRQVQDSARAGFDEQPLLVSVPPLDDARGNPEPAVAPVGLITGHDPEVLSALERTRSAVWPLVLSLTVGLAIGFAGGYGVGSHDRTPQNAVAVATAAPAGREFTESAVSEPPKPVPPVPTSVAVPSTSVAGPSTPAAAPSAALGRLLIRSMPAGASVSVDGREYGKTPATVRDLPRGPHRVRVARDGYATEERRVVISPSRPAQSVNIALERMRAPALARSSAPSPVPSSKPPSAAPVPPESPGVAAAARLAGALVVDSRPTGAKVYLDGKLIGNTPLSLQTVAAGEHAVRLERDGYRHWSSSVRIVASEQNRVTASLER